MKVMKACASVFGCLLLGGCLLSNTVKEVKQSDPVDVHYEFSEEMLLDVGIHPFDPNLPDDWKKAEKKNIRPEIRRAESYYVPYALKSALEKTGNWGVVRVLPEQASPFDLEVSGLISESNGEELTLKIQIVDASGKSWLKKNYSLKIGTLHYSASAIKSGDPFQQLYTQIADDMLALLLRKKRSDLTRLQQIADLRFAEEFLPQVYSGYLSENRKGIKSAVRLPAENDPMYERLLAIQDRERSFIDTLDRRYGEYYKGMQEPYTEWRKHSYGETSALREVRKAARNRALLGVLGVVGGIVAASESSSAIGRAAGNVAIIGGAAAISSGIAKGRESKLHSQTIKELNDGFSADMAPQTLELEERKVTLTGTAGQQYEAWRAILKEIYAVETGQSQEPP